MLMGWTGVKTRYRSERSRTTESTSMIWLAITSEETYLKWEWRFKEFHKGDCS